MSTKNEIYNGTVNCVRNNLLAGILSSLIEPMQEYLECLNILNGQELVIEGETYVLSRYGVTYDWCIEKYSNKCWLVKFSFTELDDVAVSYTCDAKVSYDARDEFDSLTHDLFNVVVYILSTYHPSGELLEFTI